MKLMMSTVHKFYLKRNTICNLVTFDPFSLVLIKEAAHFGGRAQLMGGARIQRALETSRKKAAVAYQLLELIAVLSEIYC